MIKEGNIFNKTVVLLLSGEDSNTAAKVLCDSFADSGYITKIFKINSILESFCLLLGWDGWKDSRGNSFLEIVKSAAEDYNKDCWIHLLDEHIKEQPQYPFDIIFIPDYKNINEKIYLESDPVNRVLQLKTFEESNILFLDTDNEFYSVTKEEHYSELLDKLNTIAENIINNFTTERKSEDTK